MSNNKNIENVVKDAYSDVKIPLTIDPEIMKERLYKDDDIRVKSFRIKPSRSRYVRMAAVCAVIVICVIMTSVSFTSNDNWNPIENLVKKDKVEEEISDMYASSYEEIYEVLEKINEQRSELEKNADGVVLEDTAATGTVSKSFTETNVQVSGIDEADVIKTDGSYIYNCLPFDNRITIVKADNGKMKKMSEIVYEDTLSDGEDIWLNEMYLSGNNLVVIRNTYNYATMDFDYADSKLDVVGSDKTETVVDIYDISDKSNPVKKSSHKQDGYYKSSRMNGNYLYLFTDYSTYKDIPKVEDKIMNYSDICITGCPESNNFLVMASYDVTQGKVCDEKSVLCGDEEFYVTENNIYIASQELKYKKKKYEYTTNIIKAIYSNGKMDIVAKKEIPGYIDSQFSLDEYNSYLRLIITYDTKKTTANGLFVLDDKLNIAGCIENLAKDERIYSARFYGDYGYFVTYKQIDPLFAVDLSDPHYPVIKSELKIPGFSDYLQRYDENHLFGIGYLVDNSGNQRLKISMFDISNPENVTEVDNLLLDKNCYSKATEDHRALIIDEERGLIGFSSTTYGDYTTDGEQYYNFYTFNNGKFEKYTKYDCKNLNRQIDMYFAPRAVIIGDYVYLSSVHDTGKMESYKLGKNKVIDKLKK